MCLLGVVSVGLVYVYKLFIKRRIICSNCVKGFYVLLLMLYYCNVNNCIRNLITNEKRPQAQTECIN